MVNYWILVTMAANIKNRAKSSFPSKMQQVARQQVDILRAVSCSAFVANAMYRKWRCDTNWNAYGRASITAGV